MTPGYFFLVYQSPGGKRDWRWRFVGPHRRVIAVSGDGYADKAKCVAAVENLTDESKSPVIEYGIEQRS